MYSIYYQDYYVDMGVHKNKYLASVTSSTQDSNSLEGQCQLYRIEKREQVIMKQRKPTRWINSIMTVIKPMKRSGLALIS